VTLTRTDASAKVLVDRSGGGFAAALSLPASSRPSISWHEPGRGDADAHRRLCPVPAGGAPAVDRGEAGQVATTRAR